MTPDESRQLRKNRIIFFLLFFVPFALIFANAGMGILGYVILVLVLIFVASQLDGGPGGADSGSYPVA